MSRIAQALAAGRSGTFRTTAPAERVVDLVTDAGWRAARLDTSGVRDKAALMDRLASALALPDWFGANWDGLEECLGDLDHRPGIAVVWTGSGELPRDLAEPLREVLAERAAEGRTPFVVVRTRRT